MLDARDHGSERALDVVEPDEPVVAVDEHADGVEAQLVVPRRGRTARVSQAAAILRTCDCLAPCRLSNGSPEPSRRVLTSQNTSVRPSESTRSSSPQRVWWFWARTRVAEPREVLRGEPLAEAAEVLSVTGLHARGR